MRWLVLGERLVDLFSGSIHQGGQVEAKLTSRERALLERLATADGAPVDRDTLLQEVWGHDATSLSRAVDIAARRLRKKIEADPRQPRFLLTVHGTGYRLNVPAAVPPAMAAPAPTGRFFGRATELDTLRQRLALPGTICVLGPPGCGKSRLAREAIQQRPDSAVLELEALSGSLLGALAQGMALSAGQTTDAQVCAAVAARVGVLLLDGLDDPTAPILQAIRQLRAHAPELCVLITGRVRPAIGCDLLIELPPLERGDAVALFAHHARALRPGFQAPEASLGALVDRLDRLPLAIELAAARVRMLRVEELLDHAPLRAAGSGLSDAIRASWEALSTADQRALACCCAFTGSFRAAAAMAVMGSTVPDPMEALQSLRDRSLLHAREAPGGLRLSVLSSIAAFARESAPSACASAEIAHLAWAARWSRAQLERIEETGDNAAFAAIRAEHTDLIAASQRLGRDPRLAAQAALAIGAVAVEARTAGADRPLLVAAAEAAARSAPELLTPLHTALSGLSRIVGRRDEAADAIAAAQAALPQATGAKDARRLALHRGLLCLDQRDYPAAAATLRTAVGPDALGIRARAHLAEALYSLGRVKESLQAGQQALFAAEQRGAPRLVVTAQLVLWSVLEERGDHEAALMALDAAYQTATALGNPRSAAVALSNRANLLADLGRTEEAWACAEQAMERYLRDGAERSAGAQAANLAQLSLLVGDRRALQQHAAASIALAEKTDTPAVRAQALMMLGTGAHEDGDLIEASRCFRDAIATVSGTPILEAVAGAQLGAVCAEQGAHEEARALLDHATTILADARPVFQQAVALLRCFLDLPAAGPHAEDQPRDPTELLVLRRLLRAAILRSAGQP